MHLSLLLRPSRSKAQSVGLLPALALLLAGCATSSEDADDVRGSEAAATEADGTTVLVTNDTSPSRGLTMTFSFASSSAGEHTPIVTLTRGAKTARLTCTSMSASASVGANDSFVAASCVDLTQPGFQPGSNGCEMHFNVFHGQAPPSVQFSCRNPATLTTHQVNLLNLVYGSTSAYQRVPDRTFTSSRGEVGGGGDLSSSVREGGGGDAGALQRKPENDPIAFVGHALDAARPLLGKTGSLAFMSPAGNPSTRSGAIALVTVFPDPKQMLVPINARTADGKLLISRDTSLAGSSPSGWAIASKQEITSRLLRSIDAR